MASATVSGLRPPAERRRRMQRELQRESELRSAVPAGNRERSGRTEHGRRSASRGHAARQPAGPFEGGDWTRQAYRERRARSRSNRLELAADARRRRGGSARVRRRGRQRQHERVGAHRRDHSGERERERARRGERGLTSAVTPFARAQDRLMLLVGDGVESRAVLVAGMLRREPREAAAYWLKLVVAVGIATLGLVVGSTAVIIGAMLIAPLMTPIVGLALGLATGSPFLVLRSSGRIVFSVVLVILGAAAITLLVPIHELNAEISSRASPTVLDLAIAVFCALAGVLASLRPGSDTATTAAGTSISVSLVPPLCASGYGVGTGAWSIAAGAALLFLTNLVAIALVGTCAFVLAGFNRVDVVALERRELAEGDHDSRVARWLAKKLSRLFASRGGPLLRLAMPALLLATVYLPLRRALDEVAWEVRVRAAVRSAIAAEQPRVLESRLVLDRHQVELGFVVLGTMKESERVRERVKAAVQRASGVVPQLEV